MNRMAVLFAVAASEDDLRVLGEGKAPTPFTAAEIRAGCPDGRISLFRVEGDGQSVLVRFRFRESGEETVHLETTRLSAEGKPLGKTTSREAAWRELQSHASFDAESATITDAAVEVPFGRFDCRLYTIRGSKAVQRYWFAKHVPGPPVRMEVESGGRVVQTMELVEHRAFDYAKVFGPQPSGLRPVEGLSAKAEIREVEGGGLAVAATVTGQKLPAEGSIRVTTGPLKGAVLTLERAEGGARLSCEKPLPEGFRMQVGNLPVEAVAPAAAE